MVALLLAALELASAWVEPWTFFHDEIYYWVTARRFALGYVDHPPLASWVLAAATAVLGDGRLGFRLVPSLAAALTVLLTGWMARRLGAGTFGQALAGLSVAVMPFALVLFSFYSVNALEIVLWTATTVLLVELLRTGNERLWLGIGVIAGLGLLNKHTYVLLAAGIAAGILASPRRARVRSGWLWLGAATALAIAMPNLVWNAQNGWPSVAFYRSRPAADLPATVAEALEIQMLGTNPVNVLVWVPGLLFLLFATRARAFRPVAIAFLALLVVVLLSNQRRGDRIAGIYPSVLAAGAAFWDGWRGRGRAAVRVVLPAAVLVFGALVVPATLPILSPAAVGRYLEAVGEKPEIETADVGQALPLYLAGRLWWPRFADAVAEAWQALPRGERERAVVLAPHWVFASVVEYRGRDRALRPVVAPHNAYWFWREDAVGRDVALAVAIPSGVLARYFAETREVGVFRCDYCGTLPPELPIVLASRPVRPIPELLAEWRTFSIEPTPQLTR